MLAPTSQDDYDVVAGAATTSEAGGLAKPRSVLLLWFLRNVVGLDDLDAYEFVCDGDADGGVDGLRLERSSGDEDFETLVVYQSKYTQGPTQVGPGSIDALLGRADRFKDSGALSQFLAEGVEEKLRSLIKHFGLIRKLQDGAYDDGRLRVRLVFVSTGKLNTAAGNQLDAANAANGLGYVTAYDLRKLAPLARAASAPEPQSKPVEAPCAAHERMIIGSGHNRVAMAAVKAKDIVGWPGIDDRMLFELNVRRELRRNKVARKLDGAVGQQHEHKDFLAFHNGLTMVCEEIEEQPDKLIAKRPSIVNGTQSVLAFDRGNAEGNLTDGLRIFVKFVEVKGRPQLAKEVSGRSNTQTAVNSRNLVALGGPQERLQKEFENRYPEVYYETRPDATLDAGTAARKIPNDAAAQLLCAVYNAEPWLAVKRLSLFESENHAFIFGEDITAAHVYLVDVIREAVEDKRGRFPEKYRGSWQLTRLVAIYLVGQILRTDEELRKILDNPADAISDLQALKNKLKRPVIVAAETLKQRFEKLETDAQPDEFNVDFKRREALHLLRDAAKNNFGLMQALEGLEDV